MRIRFTDQVLRPIYERFSPNWRGRIRYVWHRKRILIILAMIVIGYGEYRLLKFLGYWNSILRSEIIALVVTEVPLGIILVVVFARSLRRAGATDDVSFFEAKRDYMHLQLYVLRSLKKEDIETRRKARYMMWNRKTNFVLYAENWLVGLADSGILETNSVNFQSLVEFEDHFTKKGIHVTLLKRVPIEGELSKQPND